MIETKTTPFDEDLSRERALLAVADENYNRVFDQLAAMETVPVENPDALFQAARRECLACEATVGVYELFVKHWRMTAEVVARQNRSLTFSQFFEVFRLSFDEPTSQEGKQP